MEELFQERSSVIYYKNKANWMEYGEKCTKLFFNLQNRNATKTNVLKLVTNDGVTNDSPNDILKELVKYFKNMSPPSPLTEANCINICTERLT